MTSPIQKLTDNQSAGLIHIDQDGLVTYMNPAAENILCSSLSNIKGQAFVQLLKPNSNCKKTLSQALQKNQSISLREITWTLINGTKLTLDLAITPIDADSDNGLLLELWPIDRKLRIRREEQRNAIQDAAQNMLRSLAHEVKNPLAGIRGAAQLLARQNPETEEYTKVIVDEADRLRNLVDRLNAPHHTSPPALINIHAVLERVATLIHGEYGDRIELIRDYDPSIPDIPGHEDLLIQAILNLARNAAQSVQESGQHDGRIILRSRVTSRFTLQHQQHALTCRITVEDNGPGIPEDIRESMFLPLVTGRATGTGLGLSICQSVIHQHKGLLECFSDKQKTCFDIYLPLTNTQKNHKQTHSTNKQPKTK